MKLYSCVQEGLLLTIKVTDFISSCLFNLATSSQPFGYFLDSLKPVDVLLLILMKTCTPVEWTYRKQTQWRNQKKGAICDEWLALALLLK